MLALAAAAVYAPDDADFTLWADCQSVVSGFAQLEVIADDHKNFYAGIWRIVRAALRDNGCNMSVKKVKAHRLVADVPDSEMFWWQGNEAADRWAKLGADDRNEAWGDLVDKILTDNLHKARSVVKWLAEGAWPDGRALGKCMGRVARADLDLRPKPRAHEWAWYAKGWRCSKCGVRRRTIGGGHGACTERFDISGINPDHRHLRKAVGPGGVPIVFCAMCGGARTGQTGGLKKSCVLMCGSNAAKERLKRLKEGRHPYRAYTYLIDLVGPVCEGWAARECPSGPPHGCGRLVGGKQDGPLCEDISMVLRQVVSEQEHADLLTLLRYEEALEAFTEDGMDVGLGDLGHVSEVEDPFHHSGRDFDAA
jgi:hypothetical protein